MFHSSTSVPALSPQMYMIDSNALPHLLASGCVRLVGPFDQSKHIDQAPVMGFDFRDQGKQPSSSTGSILHGTGKCRPCAWFWKQGGCRNGADCCHCHMCPEGELKNRKKTKHAAMWNERESVSRPDASDYTQDAYIDEKFKVGHNWQFPNEMSVKVKSHFAVPRDEIAIDQESAAGAANSIASSEDESIMVSVESKHIASCPCKPPGLELPIIDAKTDAVTSALQSMLVACLPGDSVKIEKSLVDESRRVLILADAQHGTRVGCYEIMQELKQHLSEFVTRSEGLALLCSRVGREDYGYSLRSSVACIPEDKIDQICWDVLRKGSCPKRKCCHWYHPQAGDIVKFTVHMRCVVESEKIDPAIS